MNPLEENAERQAPSKPERTAGALKLTAALLVLPALYLGVSYARAPKIVPEPSMTQTQPAAQASVADLEAAAKIKPDSANRINLAMAYINSGQAGRAMPILLSVVAEEKNNSVAWNDLCVANTLQKQFSVAIEDCNTALRLEPNFTLARNNLKWAQDESNKALLAKATPSTSTTAAQESHTAASYIDEGLKQEQLGFHEQAIESWQHALTLDPANAVAMNNVGTALMMEKKTDEAVGWFNKALQLDPGMQLAKNNLAWARAEQAKR